MRMHALNRDRMSRPRLIRDGEFIQAGRPAHWRALTRPAPIMAWACAEVSTASIEEKLPKKLATKMWLISPRDFNHIFVINGSPGTGRQRACLAQDPKLHAALPLLVALASVAGEDRRVRRGYPSAAGRRRWLAGQGQTRPRDLVGHGVLGGRHGAEEGLSSPLDGGRGSGTPGGSVVVVVAVVHGVEAFDEGGGVVIFPQRFQGVQWRCPRCRTARPGPCPGPDRRVPVPELWMTSVPPGLRRGQDGA